jgi:TRAP-type mannitol/chloroaromatic compound transport system substrate-binding protein
MTEQENKIPSATIAGEGQRPVASDAPDEKRRGFLKTAAAVGATTLVGAPFIRNAEAAKGNVWKVQTTWDAGTTGYTLFDEWAKSLKEKSGGELDMQPFAAKSVAADNSALFDAVRNGVIQGMNPFTLYWAGKIPASVFLSSYPAGPDQPMQWDTMFYGLGMLEMAREIYRKLGLVYVGPIQHDANIIHSKRPVNSLADLKGMKIRLPGGMVAEVFQKFGVSTVSLPGSDIFPALEKGTIDAADYVGPAVNWDLGFGQVTKYILFGPPGTMSLYQPVDLMDLTVNARAWDRLTPRMQQFVEEQVHAYSLHHYVTIQKRNMVAMDEFLKSGSEVSRLSGADVIEFRKAAIPVWFEWANKDADAKRVFDLQLNYMKNDIMGYVTEADLAGLS